MRFHPGGLEKEREVTVEFHRWERDFINRIALDVEFAPEWLDPFISAQSLEVYGVHFFETPKQALMAGQDCMTSELEVASESQPKASP